MQTKQQIRQLLISAGISPNKRLGQHFLIDLNLMRLLVDSANISANDVVLEVGCGTGSLTEALVEKAARVVAVELDPKIAEIAGARLEKAENLDLIQADVLDGKNTLSRRVADALDSARRSCTGRLLLVANLPYSVACPLMMNLVVGPTVADAMYVTVQKQVADRMAAPPGAPHYGAVSILLAATGRVSTIRVLKPAVFWPRPLVDSAMVAFERNEDKCTQIRDLTILTQILDLFMGHRRKMLKASAKLAPAHLAAIPDWLELFRRCAIDPTSRPEQISPEDYVALANAATPDRPRP